MTLLLGKDGKIFGLWMFELPFFEIRLHRFVKSLAPDVFFQKF